MEAIKKIKVTALCNGIKPRDRKSKPQRKDLYYLDHIKPEEVTEDEIKQAKAAAKIWATEFRSMFDLKIKLQPVELKEDQFGTIESYIMFTDKTIFVH